MDCVVEESRSIIFLDIDGVISPIDVSNHHVPVYREWYYRYEAKKYLRKHQFSILPYDIYLVKKYWNRQAIGRIKRLAKVTNSRIVMTSTWCKTYSNTNQMRNLLRMVGLDDVYLDNAYQPNKAAGVRDYLNRHPEVETYVIFDDQDEWGLQQGFDKHFLRTHNLFTENDYRQAISILQTELSNSK